VRDSGDIAVQHGDASMAYLAEHIPSEALPRGKKAVALWLPALAAMFECISEIFKAGKIPNARELDETLVGDETKHKFYKVYAKQGAGCVSVLEALVHAAREDWEVGTFKDAHCDSKWDALPTCEAHDLDWEMAMAALLE
jgi:hypothetical protein